MATLVNAGTGPSRLKKPAQVKMRLGAAAEPPSPGKSPPGLQQAPPFPPPGVRPAGILLSSWKLEEWGCPEAPEQGRGPRS